MVLTCVFPMNAKGTFCKTIHNNNTQLPEKTVTIKLNVMLQILQQKNPLFYIVRLFSMLQNTYNEVLVFFSIPFMSVNQRRSCQATEGQSSDLKLDFSVTCKPCLTNRLCTFCCCQSLKWTSQNEFKMPLLKTVIGCF